MCRSIFKITGLIIIIVAIAGRDSPAPWPTARIGADCSSRRRFSRSTLASF